MEKIVEKAIKIDLHIHSVRSAFKDGDIVKNSNMGNTSTLIDALVSHGVNLCAITDHDSFDFSLYSELKKQEKQENCIKKVLPGVEFTVTFNRKNMNKPLHIIAIFDDENVEKVKQIEDILSFDKTNKPAYDNKATFTEEKFLNILSSIDLDTVLIVHQKQTLSSDNSPKQNDANSLGVDVFNEFLMAEYFEAFEFKNKRNIVFNNLEKQKYDNDLLRFITGSDCHDWSVYPNHDSKSKDDGFKHTYIKSLPTFRGLAFALTDETRINLLDNFFTSNPKNFIKSIDLTIKGKKVNIPLSKGINAIIGDNSIGKSLLLHKLTKYYRSDTDKNLSPLSQQIITGYNRYLLEKEISLETVLEQNMIFGFDTQGEIRKKFNLGLLKDKDFFKDKYPVDVDSTEVKEKVVNVISNAVKLISNKFAFDEKYASIGDVNLLADEINPDALSIELCDNNVFDNKLVEIKHIKNLRQEVISKLNALNKCDINETERSKITEFISYLNEQNKIVDNEIERIEKEAKKINALNIVFNEFIEKASRVNSPEDNVYSDYINSINTFSKQICDTISKKLGVKDLVYDIKECAIKPTEKPYLDYVFIKKTAIQKVDNEYVDNILRKPFKKNKQFPRIRDINKKTFIDMLLKYDEKEDSNPIDFYEKKMLKEIENNFNNIASIVQKTENTRKEYSDGVNAHVYFDIISSNNYQNGIYLIDQPEDDVSPVAIKKYLLKDFKRMGRDRQILLITHNPQFVVNLDADNVICITQNIEKNIEIKSGALEYRDQKVDIIKTVAETLEGGIESIKKRWKRYEKNNID